MRIALLGLPLLTWLATPAGASDEFPPPEFDESYHYPHVSQPQPRAEWAETVDIGVLALVLCLAAYLVLKKRKRRDIALLGVFSLIYFGFYREGCICAIGAIQNVSLAAFSAEYALPISAAAFFLLPLLFVLLFGRVFCGAACPLGAAQEVVLLRAVRVPVWLDSALGTVPYIYLGAAVLFAATGSAFVICDYDPFVLFFRLAGGTGMLIFGIAILLLSTVVGRPYCRYLCPYGVLLRLLAPFSKWQVRITPAECINCHLCADACPYGAIRPPTPEPGSVGRTAGRGKLAALIVLMPVLIGLGAVMARLSSPLLARLHPKVQLANELRLEERGDTTEPTERTDAFALQGRSSAGVYIEAAAIHARFHVGSWIFGGWLGLVLGLKMIGLSVRRHRSDYSADPGSCLACARCYAACPIEHADADALALLSVDKQP